MKFVLIAILIVLSGCASVKTTENEVIPLSCIHPGVPVVFRPKDPTFNSGALEYTADTGEKIFLTGASCMRVTK